MPMPPLIDLLPPGQGGDLTERVGSTGPGEFMISVKDAHVTELYRIDWDLRYAAALTMLGFSTVEGGSSLHREPPMRHPYWEWLHCTAIRGKGKQFKGIHATSLPDQPYYADYTYCELEATFEPLRYSALTDDEVTNEDERYLYVEAVPELEILHLKQGSLVFLEGPQSLDTKARMAPGEFVLRTPKMAFRVTWFQVPANWIEGPDGDFPLIQLKLGKVNDAIWEIGDFSSGTFLHFEKWTALLHSAQLNKYVASIRTGFSTEPEYYYDVTLNILKFDPKNRHSDLHRGHQLAPYRVDNVYYLVARTGLDGSVSTAPQKFIYEEVSFDDMFDMAT